MRPNFKDHLEKTEWFKEPGAYVLVDGQFGSTGKGLGEQVLAQYAGERIEVVTTNAGPNSGHTIYQDGRKIVTKQVPSFSIEASRWVKPPSLYLNAGAIIDREILDKEAHFVDNSLLLIHPSAAAIKPEHYETQASLSAIASTQMGTGPALADKVMRKKFAVASERFDFETYKIGARAWDWKRERVFVSTAQGFSLGLNQGFYPYTTSRECSVQQALSDANIPARRLRKVITVHRVHPIRVGNTPTGTSGGVYPDQRETTWGALGVRPELTTVTKRVRRVFTWSWTQFCDCLRANEPDALFINFMNYMTSSATAQEFISGVYNTFNRIRGCSPDFVLLGYGPEPKNVHFAETVEHAKFLVDQYAGEFLVDQYAGESPVAA
jgi:adenylosuccinate synthase